MRPLTALLWTILVLMVLTLGAMSRCAEQEIREPAPSPSAALTLLDS